METALCVFREYSHNKLHSVSLIRKADYDIWMHTSKCLSLTVLTLYAHWAAYVIPTLVETLNLYEGKKIYKYIG